MTSERPPRWAEAWLRLLLAAHDRETVSGDLLEEYRENVRPTRSRLAADAWYIGQVARFGQGLIPWALGVAGIFVARTAIDWFGPVQDPLGQLTLARWTTAVIFVAPLTVGFCTAWRVRTAAAGAVNTVVVLVCAAIIAAIVNGCACIAAFDAIDPAAVARAGGLAEVFSLPFLIVLPGAIDGWFGGYLATWAQPQIKRRSTRT
jgi:hypothetical protein